MDIVDCDDLITATKHTQYSTSSAQIIGANGKAGDAVASALKAAEDVLAAAAASSSTEDSKRRKVDDVKGGDGGDDQSSMHLG